MSETQTIPTPANDALRAAEPAFRETQQRFLAQARERLSASLTAEQAIAKVLEEHRHLSKKHVATKTKAVQILASEEWRASADAQTLRTLTREAAAEDTILERIENSSGLTDFHQQTLRGLVEQVWETEKMFDTVAALRQAAQHRRNWLGVKEAILGGGLAPVQALRDIVRSVERDLHLSHKHRVLSRSTSLSRNLCEDLDTEADVEWLEKARRILREEI